MSAPSRSQAPVVEVCALLARGYLRLLANRGESRMVTTAGREPRISVDSCGQQSVNGVDTDGERYA